MVDEIYYKFFPRDLDSIEMLTNLLLKDFPEGADPYEAFNTYMRLQEVELRSIIRKQKESFDVNNFAFFLQDLLSELYAAIEFHNSVRSNCNIDEHVRTLRSVLENFNMKILSGLTGKYMRTFPTLFVGSKVFNETSIGFIVNSELEEKEPFRLSYLIATGKVHYDSRDFYYKQELYTSAARLSKEINVNRIYLSHLKSNALGPNNKNIFSYGRHHIHKYIIAKLKSMNSEPAPFYLEKLEEAYR